MKYLTINRIPLLLFVLSLVAIGLGYVLLRNPQLFGLCPVDAVRNCLSEFLRYGVGKPLWEGIYILPAVFFVFIFLRKEMLKVWYWFTFFYFIVAFLIVVSVPAVGGGIFPLWRVHYVQFFSYLFAALSFLIILLRYALLKWRGK